MGTNTIRINNTNSMNTNIHNELNIIAKEIDVWGRKNFSIRIPKMGLLEEAGEIAHCFLKRAQGIRDMDKPDLFRKKAGDAVADFMIYLMHYMIIEDQKFLSGDFKDFNPEETPDLTDQSNMEEFFGLFSERVSQVLQGYDDYAPILAMDMMVLCDHIGLDLFEIIELTWRRVKTRDWKKNPTDAHKVAGDE